MTSLEVTKSERENNQSLIRRFTRRLRSSGILRAARKAQFRQRPRSKTMMRKAALRRLEKREQYERDRKLGKV